MKKTKLLFCALSMLISQEVIAEISFRFYDWMEIFSDKGVHTQNWSHDEIKLKETGDTVTASLTFHCDKHGEVAYVRFKPFAPDLSSIATKKGDYSVMTVKRRLNNDIENVILAKKELATVNRWWSDSKHPLTISEYLAFENPQQAIQDFIKEGSYELEFNWEGEGIVRFEWNMEESAEKIEKARTKCKEIRE